MHLNSFPCFLPDKSFLILDSDLVKQSWLELNTNPTTWTPPKKIVGIVDTSC